MRNEFLIPKASAAKEKLRISVQVNWRTAGYHELARGGR